jgi:hypothetical protein
MIDLEKLVPLPSRREIVCAPCGTIYPHAYYPDDLRAIRLAAWNAALEAAIKAVEHEAFPSELPRFGVATDKLRDMRIEPPK